MPILLGSVILVPSICPVEVTARDLKVLPVGLSTWNHCRAFSLSLTSK